MNLVRLDDDKHFH